MSDDVRSLVTDHCLDCHRGVAAPASLDLHRLLATSNLVADFRVWEKIADVVHQRRMPPADALQLDDDARDRLVGRIHSQLQQAALAGAGDPGRVTMRRLTSAEYTHTIHDLTGLRIDFHHSLAGDAAGGAGFTNVGDVQFLQDSTMERYLEAARAVAAHAVIGAGPLRFADDPGVTGRELSAIRRIQDIYRQHGFRAAAGEGGEPFGLDRYARAFFVAWQFRHRDSLGFGTATLEQLAQAEQLPTRFVDHVWNIMTGAATSLPTHEVVERWHQLPTPIAGVPIDEVQSDARRACDRLFEHLQGWQRRLARRASDGEEAALLTADAIELQPTATFRSNLRWPVGTTTASVTLQTATATADSIAAATLQWRRPAIRFRLADRTSQEPVELVTVLTPECHDRLARMPDVRAPRDGEDGAWIARGESSLTLEFQVPADSMGGAFTVQSQQEDNGAQSIVRCTVTSSNLGTTAADSGETSAILGVSAGPQFDRWQAGAREFAQLFPAISHREPTPSDRDPIPAPYDNTYNSAERNEFHYQIKYHRDDAFLVAHLLDDATRQELDQAWTDLLFSFDYHDTYLEFVAKKYEIALPERAMEGVDLAWIQQLPNQAAPHVRRLYESYHAGRQALQSAQSGQVANTLQWAERAWRRPLTSQEKEDLQAFYERLRGPLQLTHEAALRALLTRIMVAPAFIFRLEPLVAKDVDVVELSQWELACRLSYFLWSSPPDDVLRLAAENGRLADDKELSAQVHRMLRDPKAQRFATEFFGQWFGFYRFDEYAGVDSQRFPQFDQALKTAMYDEAVAFFTHIVRENRPAREILFASYGFWNDRLRRHYGAPVGCEELPVTEIHFVADVSAYRRGGLLGLGAIQTVTSAPLRTSPVKRGDWVLRRILGTPVPPPPADAGSIPADDVLADGLSVQDRLIAHRQDASCVNCHTRMDPLGFALENYDAIGQWRDTYRNGQSIETSSKLHDGSTIDGPSGLRDHLQKHEQEFLRTLSTKLLGYALGRGELLTDRLLIEQMMADLASDGGFAPLAERIVSSRQFRSRRSFGDRADPSSSP